MSTTKPPAGVSFVSLLVGAGAVAFLVVALEGASGAVSVLLTLFGTLLLVAVARGLKRLRAWAWFVTTTGLLVASALVFVKGIIAVDANRAVPVAHAALLVGLLAAFRYLAREKIERHFRPDHFAH